MSERVVQRKYSLAEIDRMRGSLMFLVRGNEMKCEDQLRTYMLNGTDPVELERSVAEEINERIDTARYDPNLIFRRNFSRVDFIQKSAGTVQPNAPARFRLHV